MTPVLDLAAAFARFPTLTTPRLALREVLEADLAAWHRIYSDPAVLRYAGRHPHRLLDETRHKIADVARSFTAREGVRWGFAHRESGELIGSGGYWRIDKPNFRAEIGYELSPSVWGQGYANEALTEILRFGFAEMGLHSVEANVDPENRASIRLLERLGFTREGLFREDYFFDGRFYDTGTYSLLRPGA